VAPTNRDQAIAAATYLKREASRAVLVQDVKQGDDYLKSLGEAFRQGFKDQSPDPPKRQIVGLETYDSGLGGAANTMGAMLRNICQEKPDLVFFAGRSPALNAFVQALPARPCLHEVPIKIVAGADAVEFAAEVASSPDLRRGLDSNASVIYTTQAHPGAWKISEGSFNPEPKRHFGSCEGCFIHYFPSEPLDDGASIIGYDAIVIGVTAIRPGQGNEINDQPELISQQFNRMHGTEAVAGASGWISLKDGRDGSTVNKAVAILQVTTDGSVKFLNLSSVDGVPCVPTMTNC
jgi:hypothetical protein